MGSLFLVLIFVVKRGESIIESRAAERLRLEEQLQRTEHLSRLGEMVAGVSHEIRNPLGIIRSSAELLKKKLAGNSIADIIVEESSRMDNIINDFLNFARPKNPVLSPCRIDKIVAKCLAYIATREDAGAYDMDTHYDADLPTIMADGDMLYQAFLNILINAMQAMPDGGPIRVTVDTIRNLARVRLRFEDRGEGLDPDLLPKIWNPFFTTKDQGTGLGLGIVKNIIESHGGTVELENRPGDGTRVTVELPVGKPAAANRLSGR
jgi:signal transduction histidine kinase